MQSLLVRDVSPRVVEALKRRAKANHRSLQGELLVVLEEAAARAPYPEPPPPLALVLSDAPGPASWSREEMYGDEGR